MEMMRRDRWLWIALAGIAIVLIGALANVVVTGGAGWSQDEYLADNSPAGVVHNAYVALERNDQARLQQLWAPPTPQSQEQPGLPRPAPPLRNPDEALRVRIGQTHITGDSATVEVTLSRFYADSPFTRSESTYAKVIPLARSTAGWQITDPSLGY